MVDLKSLSNIELANEMNRLTHRNGELSLWMDESHRRICSLILEGPDAALKSQMQAAENHGVVSMYALSGTIQRELELKQAAEVERYTVLANLKKIELEMDARVG